MCARGHGSKENLVRWRGSRLVVGEFSEPECELEQALSAPNVDVRDAHMDEARGMNRRRSLSGAVEDQASHQDELGIGSAVARLASLSGATLQVAMPTSAGPRIARLDGALLALPGSELEAVARARQEEARRKRARRDAKASLGGQLQDAQYANALAVLGSVTSARALQEARVLSVSGARPTMRTVGATWSPLKTASSSSSRMQ